MGFIMDGLDAEAYDRSYTDRQLLDRILSYFKPHLPAMGVVAGTIVLNSLMETALPLLIARGIDSIAAGSTFTQVAILLGTILVSGVLAWAPCFCLIQRGPISTAPSRVSVPLPITK